MKGRTTFHLLVVLILIGAVAPCAAATNSTPFFSINSPDHPRCWHVGADFDKLDQALRWDGLHQVLCLDITYTLQGVWPVREDPYLYNRFTVRFPAVHLNPSSRQLYFASSPSTRTFIGSVQPSFFGPQVVLDRNVEVSAHRRNGVIDAAIVIFPPNRR